MRICTIENGQVIYRDMTPEEEAEIRKSSMNANPKATVRIQPGEYFTINGETYKATTIIPAGDTIIPGTNCQQTDLAAALNALNT